MATRSSSPRTRVKKGLLAKMKTLEMAGVTHTKKIRSPAAKGAASAKKKVPPPRSSQKTAVNAGEVQLPSPPIPKPKGDVQGEGIKGGGVSLLQTGWEGKNLNREERIEALRQLNEEVKKCRQCSLLAATRTQTVFGVGNPLARLCFFGEAPGADEDRQGEPFVGRAGQLLTKIIEACTFQREDVFILNVLKCRPPDNRNPLPAEMVNCRPFFEKQLEILRPEFICCLGSVAARALLETEEPVGKLRGKFHRYRGSKVLCTYHPAYLLRNPPAKKDVWEDMKILLKEMGVPIPKV